MRRRCGSDKALSEVFENVLENQKIGGDKEEMRRRRGGNKALFTKYEVGT